MSERNLLRPHLKRNVCAGRIPPSKESYQVLLAQVEAINQRLKQPQLGPTGGYFQEPRKPSAPPVNTLFGAEPSVPGPVSFTFPPSPDLAKEIPDEESSGENLP